MANRQELERKAAAKVELYRRGALKGYFLSYCYFMDYKFFSRRAFILEVIAVLQKVFDSYSSGVVTNAGISLPPRGGKSYCVSMFCSFMLGHYPTESIMRNTCTSSLYEKLSKDTREIVTSDKWQSMFKVPLKTRGVKSWSLEGAKQCSYFGSGVGGSVIGFGASMLDISDDLYRGFSDAMSEVVNDATISWCDAVRGSRVERGCCSLDIGTRWRKSDIIGRNEGMGKYNYIIRVPALTDEGKSFCEDVQTTEHYLTEKNNIAAEIWDAEYMQAPVDIKGKLFNHDDLQWYDGTLPSEDYDANLGVCDTADEGKDNLSCPMAKKFGDLYYIYDWIFTTEPVEVTEPLICGALRVNNVSMMRFESNNGGKLFAQNIAKKVDANVTWQYSTSNKETRILNDSAWIKKHLVFRNDMKPGSEYDRALQMLIAYVKGVSKQKDDAPDSLSLFCRFTNELGFNNKTKTENEWVSIPISSGQIRL